MITSFTTPYTCAAASLTGHASNVTGAAWTITTAACPDGLAHKVTVRNDAAVDHSGKTITLVGLGANGEVVTEVLTAPNVSATVTSAKFYRHLTSITPSATIGADTMDIGWTAAAMTPWVAILKIPATVAVYITGTINYDIQHSHADNALDANLYPFTSDSGKTANFEHAYTAPVKCARVLVNSHTSGTLAVSTLF